MHTAVSHSYLTTDRAPASARRVSRPWVPALLAGLLLLPASLEARAAQGPVGTVPRVAGAVDDEASKQSPGREEMLKNLEVKRRELAYKENIDRAKESAALGAEIRQAYERSKALGSAEQKKLGRLEKLARTIREDAGGDDDKEGLKEVPGDPATSFVQLQKLSEELQTKVEKTPRHVVSTSVINTANRLLGLIRHIRASFK